MKYLSLFSGIGAFEKALDYLNVKYELVNYCEIDKYASVSYSLIHSVSEDMNLGDITKVDTSKLPNDIDLISYGFPCQDISLAGKQKGFFQENIMEALKRLEFTDEEIKNLYIYISSEKPSDSQLFDKLYDEFLLYEDDINALLLMGINKLTRSGLFFEALRIIEATKPKVAIAENVKNLVSKKFKTEFGIVLKSLEEAGYNNYWRVLNAKDYGIPQNRERVFIVSIRKDIDNGLFKFPEPFELKLRLKDMLEDDVDEKYFLSEAMIKYISFTGTKNFKNPDCGGNHEPKLLIKNATKKGYIEAEEGDGIDISGRMEYHRGNVQKGMCQTITTDGGNSRGVVVAAAMRGRGEDNHQQIEVSDREYANAITTIQKDSMVAIKDSKWTPTQAQMITPDGNVKRYIGSDVVDEFNEGDCADISFPNGYNKANRVFKGYSPAINGTTTASSFITKIEGLRIRKLTPTECFRLMGFEDEVINTLLGKVSNTQLYKQAGNSIVVDVLEEIFVELFKIIA